MVNTPQKKVWLGEFGREYTDRNMASPNENDKLDTMYVFAEKRGKQQAGVSEIWTY